MVLTLKSCMKEATASSELQVTDEVVVFNTVSLDPVLLRRTASVDERTVTDRVIFSPIPVNKRKT